MATIKIEIKMPEPKQLKRVEEKKMTLLERAQYAVDCVESGHEEEKAYDFIRKINNLIQSKPAGKLNKAEKEILKEIRPLIRKLGFSDNEGTRIESHHMMDIDSDESESDYENRKRKEGR